MEKKLKTAFLITAYNNQLQLINLINCLGSKGGYDNIFVHVDLKSNLNLTEIIELTSRKITINKTYKVYWGGYNQLKSIMSLIELAVQKDKYEFMILLSGQDLPIKSHDSLNTFLSQNKDKSFITSVKLPFEGWSYKNGLGRVQWFWFMDLMKLKGIHRLHIISHYIFNLFNIVRPSTKDIDFYGGSDWWMLPGEIANYCLSEFKSNKRVRNIFKYSFIPTEMFFQTIISNSVYKNSITNDSKRFIDWTNTNSGHPNALTSEYKDILLDSDCYFARKFDSMHDNQIINFFTKLF